MHKGSKATDQGHNGTSGGMSCDKSDKVSDWRNLVNMYTYVIDVSRSNIPTMLRNACKDNVALYIYIVC